MLEKIYPKFGQALTLNPVKFSGVVAQETPLDDVVEVGPLPDLLDGTLARLPVRHVGRDHDPVLADKLDDLRHEFLFGLAREVDLAVAHVLARRFGSDRRLAVSE